MTQRPPRIGIIMGSQSDWPTLEHCAKTLTEFDLPWEAQVVSAHRTPDLLYMWNLLGDLWPSSDQPPDRTPVLATPGAALHLYGKSPPLPGRKMGHVTFTGETRDNAIERSSTCRESLRLSPQINE